MSDLKNNLGLLLFSLLITPAYAEDAPAPAPAPAWIYDTSRRMVGEDIVHWGTGEDTTADLALFRARHAAIKSLTEECGGIVNVDLIPRKQYATIENDKYRAYALVSLDFSSCNYAKTTDGQSQRAKIENKTTLEAQRAYEKMLLPKEEVEEVEEVVQAPEVNRFGLTKEQQELAKYKQDMTEWALELESKQEILAAQQELDRSGDPEKIIKAIDKVHIKKNPWAKQRERDRKCAAELHHLVDVTPGGPYGSPLQKERDRIIAEKYSQCDKAAEEAINSLYQ
jgi:hypothetical protein